MISDNSKISSFQLGVLLFNTIVGVGILSLPSDVAGTLGNDGWALIVIGGAIAVFLNYLINRLTIMFEGRTFIEFGRELVTTPISDILAFIYIIYFLIILAFELRIFGEVIKMFLLESTPIEIVILTMLLVSTYLVRSNVESIGRMTMIIFPIIFIPIGILVIIFSPTLNLSNILPLFRLNIFDMVKGIPDTFFSFIGFEIIMIFMAYVKDPKKDSLKFSTLSILFVTIIYLIVFFVTLAGFGVEELKNQIWPSLDIMKSIDFPGAFVENLEGLIMAIWVLVVFSTIAPYFYSVTVIISQMLKCEKHSQFVWPIVPIIYILSLIPDNLAQVYTYVNMSSKILGTLCVIIIPIVYLIVALIKKKSRKEIDTYE